jgi:cytosine/adenosine deaminase-related metal-dependent hydrolase
MPPPKPVDPLEGPRIALGGRLVTMDDAFTVIPRGILYIEKGGVVAALAAEAPPPPGFESVPRVETRGTVFPGLIELHNHLAYNALPPWAVPRKFTNRDQWSGIPEYRKLISGPMQVVGKTPELLPAVIRYVEAKCLLGGTTTSQGIQLFSNAGVRRFYRGIVRNVEQTDDADLPEAATRVADVEAQDAHLFLARLLKQSCFLLHLSEGVDATARKHFLALRIAPAEWAISRQLAGIHSAALTAQDFALLGEKGGAMVWSPLSNLLLYGATARIQAARAAGVRIGIGSDWSPSGSKNLLGELKVARLVSEAAGGVFSDRELVAMATRTAAAILQWENVLGTLEAGKRADLVVIEGKKGDPYAALLAAAETSIRLVMINGVARYGTPSLMQKLRASGERIRVAGRERMAYLEQATADPVVAKIPLREARDRIEDAFRSLPELARRIENPPPVPAAVRARRLRGAPEPLVWSLALDELHDTGVDLRPRLPTPGGTSPTGPSRAAAAAARPLSEILEPLRPDPLTVAGDGDFFERLDAQPNLPAYIKERLKASY